MKELHNALLEINSAAIKRRVAYARDDLAYLQQIGEDCPLQNSFFDSIGSWLDLINDCADELTTSGGEDV